MKGIDLISRSGLAAALLSTSLLSGCATVKSLPMETTARLDDKAAGLTYFLPKKLVKLTITREPPDLDELKAARDEAAAALDAAKKARGGAKAVAGRQQALLNALASDADARSGQVEATELANAALAVEDVKLADAKSELEAAAKAYRAALASEDGSGCVYTGKLELLPAQADVEHRYVAQPRHNAFRDDTVKLTVTPAGLLSSTNVVAVDRTGDILVEIAGALAGTGSAGGRGAPWSMTSPQPAAKKPACGDPKTIVEIFDPADEGAKTKLADKLKLAGYPFRVAPVPPPKPANQGKDPVEKDKPVAKVTDDAGQGASSKDPASKGSAMTIYEEGRGAIFYRSPVPVSLALEQEVNGAWHTIDAMLVQLPQAGPISYVPMQASAFVKTVDDVVFTDGVITSWSPDRPSEVLEIVRLPVKVLTALISVPAQILSLRVDYSSKAKSLADQQVAEIAAARTLSKLQTCLNDASAAGSDGLACLPSPP